MAVRFITKPAAHFGLPYALYVPAGEPPKKGWPLVAFLHGAGERGGDGVKQTMVGLGPAIKKTPEQWPAIVFMPQCPEGLFWHGEVLEAVFHSLLSVENSHPVDQSRIYLTGLSMGGHGTWNLATAHPEHFAALAPICGGADPFRVRWLLPKDLPIWIFHGDADRVVPVSHSRVLLEGLKLAGKTEVNYTEYPDIGHNCWDLAYQDTRFIHWLFSQKKA